MSNRVRALSLLVVAALPFVARWIHQEYRAPAGTSEPVLRYALLAMLCVVIVAVMEAPPRTSSVTRVLIASTGVTLAVLGGEATSQVFYPASLPRFVILLTAMLVWIWLVTIGSVQATRSRRAGGAHRVLALVDGDDAARLVEDVEQGPVEQRFTLVAVLSSAGQTDLVEHCEREQVTAIVLGPEALAAPDIIDQAEQLHRVGVQVRSLDDFYDEWIGKLPLSALDRFALMGDVESVHGGYAPLKRAIDVAFAGLGSLVLLMLLPLVLVGNLVGNRGPLFFRQQRVGRGGEPFGIWKLRTMAPGAVDVSGWTTNDDPRITPFGRFMRRLHIDELPQVINIFLGELSIVGPRPEQVDYARQLEQRLPFYAARHLVRPGLTGWAQVKYRYAASEEDAFVKLQYDLHYVRHESLATDLRIIWMTVHHIITASGR